jgi:hypothetical protein
LKKGERERKKKKNRNLSGIQALARAPDHFIDG